MSLLLFLTEASNIGYGKTKREILLYVQKILEQKGSKPDHFNGEGWYFRFMQRHPRLSLRSADPVSYVRTTAFCLKAYFDLLVKTLRDKGLLDKPNFIYNMDESGMPLDHKQLKRIAPKKVHGIASGNKSQVTIVACANAAGIVLPPMVILKGERLNYEYTKGEVPGRLYLMGG